MDFPGCDRSTRDISPVAGFSIAWVALLVLAGCASLGDRAELVFVRHNAASSQLMLLLPGLEEGERLLLLEEAEADMIQACAELDRAVEAHRDGRAVSNRRAVLAGLNACEQQTGRLEQMLQ